MRFEWDPRKDKANRKKHGISFELAQRVFDDPNHLSLQDRQEGGEERWQTLGLMVHTRSCWSLIPMRMNMAKKSSASSRPEKRRVRSAGSTMSARERKELAALAKMPDSAIDTSDIPEITDWSKAQVGRFYRPIKQPVTIRLDADVIAWFKETAPQYQTAVNAVLRAFMKRQVAANDTGRSQKPRRKRG